MSHIYIRATGDSAIDSKALLTFRSSFRLTLGGLFDGKRRLMPDAPAFAASEVVLMTRV